MQIPLQICRYWYGRTGTYVPTAAFGIQMVRSGSRISESLGFGISYLHSVVLL